MTTHAAPDGLQVRPATRADLLAVHRIEQAAFEDPWPFEAFERYLDAPAFLVAVADDGARGEGGARDDGGESAGDALAAGGDGPLDLDDVVGYVVADCTPNHGRGIGHVKDLAVHPDYRERGIGSTLLERALVTLAGEGATSVKLEVRVSNESARSLYREFDFGPMRRREAYYDDGEDALVLVREI